MSNKGIRLNYEKQKKTPTSFRKLIFVIAALCILLITQLVFASSSHIVFKPGFLTNVTAYGKVISLQSSGSTNGYCAIDSYTSPATSINVIGWTWWQCDVLNSQGNIVTHHYVDGQSSSASSKSDNVSMTGAFSQTGRKLRIRTVHDFNHNGSNPSPWRPYNDNTYP